MDAQTQRASDFRKLHRGGAPLLLMNIWDVVGARAASRGGAQALATSSGAVAQALGRDDGEQISIHDLVSVVRRIVDAVDLPLTVDVEAGYGRSTGEVADNVGLVVEAGGIGVNFEDGIVNGDGLYPIEEQCQRIVAVTRALGPCKGYLNARVDVFLYAPRDRHDEQMLESALTRASAYVEHGADGIFLPGLSDRRLIETACDTLACPVNILARPGSASVAELSACGVARISLGSWPSHQVAHHLKEMAEAFHRRHRYPADPE